MNGDIIDTRLRGKRTSMSSENVWTINLLFLEALVNSYPSELDICCFTGGFPLHVRDNGLVLSRSPQDH